MSAGARPLSIVVVGASGDLARRKVLPALFALYCQGFLPPRFRVFGFARSAFTDDAFRARVAERLACRYAPGESCADRMGEFLAACHYVGGDYGSRDAFLDLYATMREHEGNAPADRMFYLAIPPSVFLDVAHAIGGAGLVACGEGTPWSRVVIEKPFGHDRASSDELTRELGRVFTEDQTFRIDHYLGKEVIQNLLVLRFANLVFEPLWNRRFIESVEIAWSEQLDLQGRGGYFDAYGIIRDVVQNHLLQILALVAMEPPRRLDATAIRDAKVAALRCVPPVPVERLVVGQYARTERGGRVFPAYAEDPSVPAGSRTPTFAAALLEVRNARWRGVPFLLRAGKALSTARTEIRVRFRVVPGNMFCGPGGCPAPNELVIRVQPDESIVLRITNKVPGMGLELAPSDLDLRYGEAFGRQIPDAYESLLLDVIRGEKSLFVRGDELAAAWDIVTPALHALARDRVVPVPYDFGGGGPAGADELLRDFREQHGGENEGETT